MKRKFVADHRENANDAIEHLQQRVRLLAAWRGLVSSDDSGAFMPLGADQHSGQLRIEPRK